MLGANAAVLSHANEALRGGDIEGFLAHCTDDTEWTLVGDVTFRGKESVRRWMADAYAVAPKFDVEQMIEADESRSPPARSS